MNILEKLDSTVKDAINSRKAFTGYVTKKQLKELLGQLQTDHLAVVKILDSAVPEIGKDVAKTVAADTATTPAYTAYRKGLNNEQRSVEGKQFMSTLLAANKKFVTILRDVEKDVDDLFSLERISLLNMRMSHVIVAGVIHQSKTLCRYTKYTLGYVSSIINELDDVPKYRERFLMKNADYVSGIVSAVNDKSGAVDYKALIKKIKQSGADYTLVDKEANSQVGAIKNSMKVGRNSEGLVMSGILGIPTFRSIGEALNIVRKEISQYLRQEEDWMRSHVAILSAKMSGMSRTDEEYAQLEKIVARYENMIDIMERIRSKVE